MRIFPPLYLCEKVSTDTPISLSASEYCAARRCPIPFNSTLAAGMPVPGLSMPKSWSGRLVRLSSAAVGASAIHMSTLAGNLNPFGMTPMMVAGFSLTRTWRPMTVAEPL